VSQRHRHEYAADLPHDLRSVFGDPTEEFPPSKQRDAPRPAQIHQISSRSTI
jgi:hypothetical protein